MRLSSFRSVVCFIPPGLTPFGTNILSSMSSRNMTLGVIFSAVESKHSPGNVPRCVAPGFTANHQPLGSSRSPLMTSTDLRRDRDARGRKSSSNFVAETVHDTNTRPKVLEVRATSPPTPPQPTTAERGRSAS